MRTEDQIGGIEKALDHLTYPIDTPERFQIQHSAWVSTYIQERERRQLAILYAQHRTIQLLSAAYAYIITETIDRQKCNNSNKDQTWPNLPNPSFYCNKPLFLSISLPIFTKNQIRVLRKTYQYLIYLIYLKKIALKQVTAI